MNLDGTTDWAEIEVPVLSGDVAEVAGMLSGMVAAAGAGVELRHNRIVFWVPRAGGESAVDETRKAVSMLSSGGVAVDEKLVRLRAARPEAQWRDAWKLHFRTQRLSRRIVVVPSWERYDARPEDLVIAMDPGRAFGTGIHASTRICLLVLDALSTPEMAPGRGTSGAPGLTRVRRFLDLGTGSGILAIAAAKLWPAATGLALDIDAVAVEAARDNLRRNGLAARVECVRGSAGAVEERFDLITANIQADILQSLRDAVTRRLAAGGYMILSGLLAGEAQAVGSAYASAAEIQLVAVRQVATDAEWAAVVLRRVEPARPFRGRG